MKKLAATKIPEKMPVEIAINAMDANLILIQSTQDVTTGFKIEFTFKAKPKVNGFEFTPFEFTTTHTLTEREFNDFMRKLS